MMLLVTLGFPLNPASRSCTGHETVLNVARGSLRECMAGSTYLPLRSPGEICQG